MAANRPMHGNVISISPECITRNNNCDTDKTSVLPILYSNRQFRAFWLCYHYSKMFRWEPEGRYHHRLCTAIAPFWFSTEHVWLVIAPFWLSNWRYVPIWILLNSIQKIGKFSIEISIYFVVCDVPDLFMSWKENGNCHREKGSISPQVKWYQFHANN